MRIAGRRGSRRVYAGPAAHVARGGEGRALRPLVQPLFAERAVSLELRPPDAALHVLADGERLIQVCLNLLTNAAKLTDPGGGSSSTASPPTAASLSA